MARSVLIVDDDASLALGVAVRLEASGYRVLAANDVPSGVTKARYESPDLILLDLGLPGGGGLKALAQIRSDEGTSRIPVIVMSARHKDDGADALEAGADVFLQKPVENQRLLAAIKSLIAA
jgi:DNA-binding response OmpR family regulator